MNNVFIPTINPTYWYDNSSITQENMGYVQYQTKVFT